RYKHLDLWPDNLNTRSSLERPAEKPGYICYATAHNISGRYHSATAGTRTEACKICPGTDATYLSASQRRSSLWTGRMPILTAGWVINATKLRCHVCQPQFLDGVSLRDVSLAASRFELVRQPSILDAFDPDILEPMASLACLT
ncbi:hypothetical protein QBC45DRAFT_332812, partial [Copromyces sp. CBS 386.78]